MHTSACCSGFLEGFGWTVGSKPGTECLSTRVRDFRGLGTGGSELKQDKFIKFISPDEGLSI